MSRVRDPSPAPNILSGYAVFWRWGLTLARTRWVAHLNTPFGMPEQPYEVRRITGDIGVITRPQAAALVVASNESLRGFAPVTLSTTGGLRREIGAVPVDPHPKRLSGDRLERRSLASPRE